MSLRDRQLSSQGWISLQGRMHNQRMIYHQAPLSSIPVGPSPKNIPKVSILDTHSDINTLNSPLDNTLPLRENRGKPPKRYSPDAEE
jgi:hypothetical protein